jgi:radical SAM protein with 4Fe4S-binding SPASM domain
MQLTAKNIKLIVRRYKWMFGSIAHIIKYVKLLWSVVWRHSIVNTYPLYLKVDLSPLCNLHCPTCVHVHKLGDGSLLDKQYFHLHQRMPVDKFQKIINEVRGKTIAVVLHYLGDPYMYPEIDKASLIAYNAGMRVHVGTNFSYSFSDQRIDAIINSGVTDLTVCVDGLTQEIYEKTRVGGKIDLVMNNLERICKRRKELNSKRMHIEVQYIRFDHNKAEETEIRKKVMSFGIDQFSVIKGNIYNYVVNDPNGTCYHYQEALPAKRRLKFPYCFWPYIGMVIKYDGEVIPCCNYRLTSQYTDIPSISLGNVFEQKVKIIWNNELYQIIRKQVFGKNMMHKSFCTGCPLLYYFEREKRYYLNLKNGNLVY